MEKYRIESSAGVELGIYEGESSAQAVAAMLRDAGYRVGELDGELVFEDPTDAEVCGGMDDYIVEASTYTIRITFNGAGYPDHAEYMIDGLPEWEVIEERDGYLVADLGGRPTFEALCAVEALERVAYVTLSFGGIAIDWEKEGAE